MATTVGNLVIKMGVDLAQVRRDMDQARTTVTNAVGSMKTAVAGLGGAIAGAFSLGAVVAFGAKMVAAAEDAEKSINRLNAVLRTTGGVAQVSANEIEKLVGALVDSTQFDDESIRNAAGELLIFKSVQGDVFRETLRLSADVAAFFGTNIPDAAAKLGRAMEDPEAAFGLLRKSGVVLGATQKDLIEQMMKVGDVAGAQRAILTELQKTFSGVASTMNTGMLKATSTLGKEWGDFLEALGRTGPVSLAVNGALSGIASVLNTVRTTIERAGDISSSISRQLPREGGRLGDMDSVRTALQGAGLTGGPQITLVGPEEMERRATEAAKKAAEDRAKAAKRASEQAIAERERYLKEMAALRVRSEEEYLNAIWANKEEEDERIRESILNQQRERQRYIDEMMKLGAKSTEDYYRAVWENMEADDDRLRKSILDNQKALEKSSDAANRFGLVFVSAFEDALKPGATLRDLIGGIESDLLRLGTRMMVTEPLMGFAQSLFKNASTARESGGIGAAISSAGSSIMESTAGKAVSSFFSGFFADGGYIPPGKWGWTGEQGMERVYGGKTGATVVPMGGGQPSVVFNISTPNASSFNASRGQIMADYSRALSTSRQRNG